MSMSVWPKCCEIKIIPSLYINQVPKKGICELQDQSFLQSVANFEAFRHFVLKEAWKTCFLEAAFYLQEKNCCASDCLVGISSPRLWTQSLCGCKFQLPRELNSSFPCNQTKSKAFAQKTTKKADSEATIGHLLAIEPTKNIFTINCKRSWFRSYNMALEVAAVWIDEE
jgi:hypothetical protein